MSTINYLICHVFVSSWVDKDYHTLIFISFELRLQLPFYQFFTDIGGHTTILVYSPVTFN